jgi:hypothetical protein
MQSDCGCVQACTSVPLEMDGVAASLCVGGRTAVVLSCHDSRTVTYADRVCTNGVLWLCVAACGCAWAALGVGGGLRGCHDCLG